MNKYDIHQTRWAHDCALAIEQIVPLDGPSMARVEAALLERWPVPQGWALVPQEPTGAMKRAGEAVSPEAERLVGALVSATLFAQESSAHAKDATAARAALAAHIEALERDAARLTWFAERCKRPGSSIRIGMEFRETTAWAIASALDDLRETIDAAMRAEEGR